MLGNSKEHSSIKIIICQTEQALECLQIGLLKTEDIVVLIQVMFSLHLTVVIDKI